MTPEGFALSSPNPLTRHYQVCTVWILKAGSLLRFHPCRKADIWLWRISASLGAPETGYISLWLMPASLGISSNTHFASPYKPSMDGINILYSLCPERPNRTLGYRQNKLWSSGTLLRFCSVWYCSRRSRWNCKQEFSLFVTRFCINSTRRSSRICTITGHSDLFVPSCVHDEELVIFHKKESVGPGEDFAIEEGILGSKLKW